MYEQSANNFFAIDIHPETEKIFRIETELKFTFS